MDFKRNRRRLLKTRILSKINSTSVSTPGNFKDLVVIQFVCLLHCVSGFRCNVSEIWISRFVYLENDAILFDFRGNSFFRLAVEG